jgi:hypothetical protein
MGQLLIYGGSAFVFYVYIGIRIHLKEKKELRRLTERYG